MYASVVAMRRCSTAAKPAVRHARASASSTPRRKKSGQTSPVTSSSTISSSGAQPQRTRSPQTSTPARPPGCSERSISTSARSGDGMYIRPSEESARSKLASAQPSASPSMRANPALRAPSAAARRRAASTIDCERSTPSTEPVAPTACATASVTNPGPQATSTTRSPAAKATLASSADCASRSCSCHSRS